MKEGSVGCDGVIDACPNAQPGRHCLIGGQTPESAPAYLPFITPMKGTFRYFSA